MPVTVVLPSRGEVAPPTTVLPPSRPLDNMRPKHASTAVLLDREGNRVAVFHRSPAYAWEHSMAERCPACSNRGGS